MDGKFSTTSPLHPPQHCIRADRSLSNDSQYLSSSSKADAAAAASEDYSLESGEANPPRTALPEVRAKLGCI